MMTNANKDNDVIYFHLPSGDFGRSGSHWVKRGFPLHIIFKLCGKTEIHLTRFNDHISEPLLRY